MGKLEDGSDVDLAILLKIVRALSLEGMLRGLEWALGQELGAPVDLVHRVLHNRRRLVNQNPSKRVQFEVKLHNTYFNLNPLSTIIAMLERKCDVEFGSGCQKAHLHRDLCSIAPRGEPSRTYRRQRTRRSLCGLQPANRHSRGAKCGLPYCFESTSGQTPHLPAPHGADRRRGGRGYRKNLLK